MPTDEGIEVLLLVNEAGAVGIDEMVRFSGLTRDAIEAAREAAQRSRSRMPSS